MPVYREKNKNKWTKDGRSYYFRCYYTDMYGNRKQKESKLYKLSSEAKEAEREFLNKVEKKDEINNNITFEDVFNEWLLIKKRIIKCTTFYRLKKCLNKQVLSFFRKYKLHSIKMDTINKWYIYLESTNISQEYQNSLIGYFKEILTYAKDNYEFDAKIVSRVQKKRISKEIKTINEAEWNFWTNEEFDIFINCVDDPLYYTIFNFLYYTGLRLGEMIALTWEDINLEKKEIYIRNNFTDKIEDKIYDIVDPKSKNSIRVVNLDDDTNELLLKHYEEEQKIYNFSKEMFVFGNVKYIAPTTFRRKLNKYIDISKVKRITPHGFRHSHASLLIHLGCDSREVAKRLGDTVQVIESTYYHMFPEKEKHTITVLNNFKKRGK